ncbi:hypothetical protein TRICI_006065 [Trichomonascus ciferrii]|uniref:INO80 complex, subunit Ies4 n=1 Tax=Trichomonascus ciferrii TaxID=44093 RepID=A0A642ULJ1_9ASCO|nr:hypothetical protein TRICI_006065 [Trichomonascus ciferrii]
METPSPSKSRIVTLKVPSKILQNYPIPASNGSTPTTAKKGGSKKKSTKSASSTIPSSPAGPDDHGPSTTTATAAATGTGHSKSGPKGGASVNANLRALDRSGAPPRKWKLEPIELKSFTGHKFTLKSWTGGQKDNDEPKKKQADSKSPPVDEKPEIKVENA